MSPGEELRKQVALKIMGWEKGSYDYSRAEHGDWCPDTNIKDAWDVVNTLYYPVETYSSPDNYHCTIWVTGLDSPITVASTLSVPHAICLAALEAVK